jgi:predicted small lipoprotein YifL
MKKAKLIQTIVPLALLTALLFGLSACGQDGPLYMPDNIPKSQRAKK